MIPYFVVSALLAFIAAATLPVAASLHPAAHVHLALAVGMLPLIFAAIAYFVPVLTRSAAAPRAFALVPAGAQAAGLALVATLTVRGHAPALFAVAASLALAAALALIAWIVRRAGAALGRPHAGLNWYLAALACLAVALLAVPAMAAWPQHYLALKRLHLHLNLLGLIGLTAVGTVQVLLPTAAGRFDPQAAARLHRTLLWALAGTFAVALGAAFWRPLAWLGMLGWAVVLAPVVLAWWRQYRAEVFRWHGSTPSLAAALAGLLIAFASGALQDIAPGGGQATAHAFVVAFLFPLVTGAASQLLPLWIRPGRQTDWHTALRLRLTRWGGLRALLFVAGGTLLALGHRAGFALAVTALLEFMAQLVHGLIRGRQLMQINKAG